VLLKRYTHIIFVYIYNAKYCIKKTIETDESCVEFACDNTRHFAKELHKLFQSRQRDLAFKKNRPYVIAGLFNDEDDEIQRTFTSAIKMVNKERYENEEFLNIYFAYEMPEIEMDPFYATSKGKKILDVT